MNHKPNTQVIQSFAEEIEIPESAYKTAIARYEDVGKWFSSAQSHSHEFDPKIGCQGSIRLGTGIKPLNDEEEYDLDLSCELGVDFDKTRHSPKDLKVLVGKDVEAYRLARRIDQAKEEKNRCWRLSYLDELKFHMDIVPCLPTTAALKVELRGLMERFGLDEAMASALADQSVHITDRTRPDYALPRATWPVSNPEGYAQWFISRMKLARPLLENFASNERKASIDEIPTYRWKTPLQRAVQILKRHRDVMFEELPDGKPISVIITTLAAQAYRGEDDLGQALVGILTSMESLVGAQRPRVPNPLNPAEDFADKWHTSEGLKLGLEDQFRRWVKQAKADFLSLSTSGDPAFVRNQATARLRVNLNERNLRSAMGLTAPAVVVSPKTTRISEPARPWSRE